MNWTDRTLLLPLVCGVVFAFPAAAQVRGVTDDTITLGTHLAMSGPLASWGTQVANGLRMRFDEQNEAGGIHRRKVELIVEDNQFNPARAAQVGNKLIEKDNVFAIIGALGTSTNLVVMPRAYEAGVLNLFPVAAGRQLYEPFNRLGFVASAPHYDNMRLAVKHLVETEGKKRICVMAQSNELGEEVKAGVTDQLKAMNMELVAETRHGPSDRDFTAAIAKLREANCDLIALGSVVVDTISPIVTARKAGWDVTFLGSSSAYASENIDLAKGATEGLYVTAQMEIPNAEAPGKMGAFVKAYRDRYSADPGFQAALGYTFADLFIAAADRAGRDLTADTFVSALEAQKGYRDPFGSGPVIEFGPEKRLGTNAAFLSRVVDGKWKKVSEVLSY